MSLFSRVMLVAGLFLVAYAVLALARRPADGGRRGQSIGCGFAVMAGLVWGIALAHYLGDWWAGMRLGFCFAMLMPALATLVRPNAGRVVAALVLLSLAVVLGAPAFPKLYQRLRPPASQATVREVESTLKDLRQRIDDTSALVERLSGEGKGLRQQLAALGYTSFEQVAADQKAYAKLRELADVERLLSDSTGRLAAMQNSADRLDGALRRLQRLAETESATGEQVDRAEIASIMEDARRQEPQQGPATVEEHVEQEQLKQLFDTEIAAH
jgi:hypothetical protein